MNSEEVDKNKDTDVLEFFLLTPLPGSADHLALARRGVPMDPDLNRYDLEHVTTAHPRMRPLEPDQVNACAGKRPPRPVS